MSSSDTDLDAPAGVTVRCRDNHAVSVRLRDSSRPDEDRVLYAVEAAAPGLAVRVDEVVAWSRGEGLAPFLEGSRPTSAGGRGGGSGGPSTATSPSTRSSAPAGMSG